MRLPALPVLMSVALFAAPAFAQSTGMTARHNPASGTSGSSGQSDQQGVTADTQQKIRHSLEQNGFKNVQVIPQSFVIRAQAPDGSRLVMEVSPDQFEEVVTPPANSGSTTSRSGSSLNNESNSPTGNSTTGGGSTTGNSSLNHNSTGNSTTGGMSR